MELKLTRALVVFDLETTGTNIATDRIVEIGALKIHTDGREEFRRHLVNPSIPIPAEVTAIHGITDEDVKDAPSFKDLSNNLLSFISNCDLAGYNCIKFDVPVLVEEFLRAGIDFDLKGRRVIDVQNIFHKMEQRTLRAAYRFYCQKELENAHTAEADARATYEILKSQLDRYADTEFTDHDGKVSTPVVNDVKALHDFSFFNRNADLAGQIIFNTKGQEVFNFGKHKGKPVEEVFRMEPSYYDWMMKGEFLLSTKKLITLIKLRNFNKG